MAIDTADSQSVPSHNLSEQAFLAAVAFVLEREGGYIIDPRDPGGETKYGISQRAYPLEDIAGLTRERAIQLYQRDYWKRCRCDELPGPLGLALFDAAVNQGVTTATKLFQRALMVQEDGIVGPETIYAASVQDTGKVLLDFIRRRILKYARSENANAFLGGWVDRALKAYTLALSEMRELVR